MADPTDSIPPGFVFLTGLCGSQRPKEVFLTRSPCTEASDGLVVRVCGEEDLNSFSDDWEFLSSLPFGAVVFPLGEPSLVSTINSGDCDGDMFFVLWHEGILAEMEKIDRLEDNFVFRTDDELVGTGFLHQGTTKAEVVGKAKDGNYLVEVESSPPATITLSREKIMAVVS